MANEPGAISHEDQLLSFLRTYDCLGLAGYAEQLCRTHLYEPLIAREFEQYNRQLPMLFDHAGASTDAGGAARQEQLELRLTEQLYASLAKVVQHDPCGLITVARASRLEFDFFSNCASVPCPCFFPARPPAAVCLHVLPARGSWLTLSSRRMLLPLGAVSVSRLRGARAWSLCQPSGLPCPGRLPTT